MLRDVLFQLSDPFCVAVQFEQGEAEVVLKYREPTVEGESFAKCSFGISQLLLIFHVGLSLQSNAFEVIGLRQNLHVAGCNFDHFFAGLNHILICFQGEVSLGHPQETLSGFFVAHVVGAFITFQRILIPMATHQIICPGNFRIISVFALSPDVWRADPNVGSERNEQTTRDHGRKSDCRSRAGVWASSERMHGSAPPCGQ